MNGGAGPADKLQDASPMQAGGNRQAGRSAAAAAVSQGQRQGKAADAGQEQHQSQKQKQPAPSTAVAAGAAAPEVAVPPEWQQPRGAAQHPRQRKQLGEQQQQPAATPAAGAGVQQPMADAAFAQLPLLTGGASVGDVLAYKLLEIGFGMQPAVSEVRCGRCVG